ncbi:MAG: hypothetical protein NC089_07970 [Bacteroides sp.]|nr:hypothetical protein [Bacteroides sp.]MCM1548463.1 hypothetical protein [Clostridium sp.]
MKEKKTRILLPIAEYGLLVLLVLLFMVQIFKLGAVRLADYPISYEIGDTITGLATVKSMADNGWIYENPFLGAPYGSNSYDATTMDIFLNAMEQLLVWLTGNWILSYNLFYLSGYLLAALTAYYALKQLKIPVWIALPTSVLYTFLPYHQQRGTGHLFLGMYFMVPIMVLYLYRLMNGELIFHKGDRGWVTPSNVLRFLALMIMALTGIYYAFFTCFFFCVVILYTILNKEDWKRVRQAAAGIGIIVGTLLVSALPNLIYWLNHGKPEAISKGGEGAELYALKIIQLLLPRQGHRRELFLRLRNLYDSAYPLANENGMSSLGIFMAAGFVILCLVLFMRKRALKQSNLQTGSILNLAAVLFGTVGGYAVALSFFTGAIRCYNRLSIFIAMFSLIAMDCVLQLAYEKWFQRKWLRVGFGIGMFCIMLCGIYDQTIPINPDIYTNYARSFDADAAFVQAIEAVEEEQAMIYQMPYMRYPENGGIHNMTDYAHMFGYLHSDTLRWSYGASAGREGDQWMCAVNDLPLQEQITAIREAGFAGIYIDWNAYLEDERIAIEDILSDTVNANPIVNADGTKAYYSFGKK